MRRDGAQAFFSGHVLQAVTGSFWLAGALVGALLLVGGCEEEEESREDRPAPVELVAVEGRTMHEYASGIGTLRPRRAATIRPEVAGRLLEAHFEEGAFVEAGELLFELDDRLLERELRSARSSLRAAEVRRQRAAQNFERLDALLAEEAISQDEWDQARTELDAAEAEVEQLEAQVELAVERLADTRIEAPFAGVVGELQIDPGNYVSTGEALVRLLQTDPIEVDFMLPERYMGRVSGGMSVEAMVGAYPDERLEGQVVFVSPEVGDRARDLQVKALLANPEGRLRPGAFARARVTLEELEDRPVLPEEALVGSRQGYLVFVVEDGRAHMREVEVGLREPGYVEIRSGVEIGQRVVRRGHMELEDGDDVREVEG